MSEKKSGKKKLSKPIVIVIVIVLAFFVFSMMGGGGNDGSSDAAAWDANAELTGMTVENAWDEIESKGYTLEKIQSVTGAELNSSENVRHSSTAQTWLVTEAEADDSAKTVSITVTSRDDFIKTFGEDEIK